MPTYPGDSNRLISEWRRGRFDQYDLELLCVALRLLFHTVTRAGARIVPHSLRRVCNFLKYSRLNEISHHTA
jgi:hypothetical protein